MRKALKELIENALDKSSGEFTCFIFLDNGIYEGFWGKNGYDNILVLGYERNVKKWCKITHKDQQVDIFTIFKPRNFNLHFKHELGVAEIWFDMPVKIDNSVGTSTILGGIDN